MSLLLDALKKAALEKQKKDEQESSDVREAANDTELPSTLPPPDRRSSELDLSRVSANEEESPAPHDFSSLESSVEADETPDAEAPHEDQPSTDSLEMLEGAEIVTLESETSIEPQHEPAQDVPQPASESEDLVEHNFDIDVDFDNLDTLDHHTEANPSKLDSPDTLAQSGGDFSIAPQGEASALDPSEPALDSNSIPQSENAFEAPEPAAPPLTMQDENKFAETGPSEVNIEKNYEETAQAQEASEFPSTDMQVEVEGAQPTTAMAALDEVKTEEQNKKEAIAKLIENSKRSVATSRRRTLVLFGTLLALGTGLISFYLYYLYTDLSSNFRIPEGQNYAELNSAPQVNMPNPDISLGDIDASEADSENSSENSVVTRTSNPEQSAEAPTSPDGSKDKSSAKPKNNLATEQELNSVHASSGTGPSKKFENSSSNRSSKDSTANKVTLEKKTASPVRTKPTPNILALPQRAPKSKNSTRAAEVKTLTVSQRVEKAYQAYLHGNLDLAEREYKIALQQAPDYRDALLGAAAIATQKGNAHEALLLYHQRLAQDPSDEFAHGGIIALVNVGGSDTLLESELNLLIKENPDAAYLHFIKGSLQATHKQWHVAQDAFFAAWSRDKRNPDYAYNLAVSLDHLREYASALKYYRHATAYAATRTFHFDLGKVDDRIQILQGSIK